MRILSWPMVYLGWIPSIAYSPPSTTKNDPNTEPGMILEYGPTLAFVYGPTLAFVHPQTKLR